jgi:hypothetical protein
MSDQQENQQVYEEEQHQQQHNDDDGYSSSEDEWTRPSVNDPNHQQQHQVEHLQQQQDESIEKKIDYSWDQDEKALAGNDVRIVFEIVQQGEIKRLAPLTFVMGVTIAHLKSHLEDNLKIPYTSQQMTLGDRVLIDPLSLNDLGFESGGVENIVRVVVEDN